MEEKTHRGVSYYKRTNQWRARIFVDKKEISLGYFKNEAEAIEARKKAEGDGYITRGKHPNSRLNSPYVEGHEGMKGETNPSWKGDDVGYGGLHMWVSSQLGTPSLCEHCQSTTAKHYDWANKSQTYKRDLSDWLRLCRKCHKKYDNT